MSSTPLTLVEEGRLILQAPLSALADMDIDAKWRPPSSNEPVRGIIDLWEWWSHQGLSEWSLKEAGNITGISPSSNANGNLGWKFHHLTINYTRNWLVLSDTWMYMYISLLTTKVFVQAKFGKSAFFKRKKKNCQKSPLCWNHLETPWFFLRLPKALIYELYFIPLMSIRSSPELEYTMLPYKFVWEGTPLPITSI